MKKLTSEQIKEKEALFSEKLDEAIENKKLGISPTQQFLNEIESQIKKAVENELSFTQLSKTIYAVYNVKVSAQTLRAFAQNKLGVEKKKRGAKKSNSAAASVEDKVSNDKVAEKPKSMQEMKEAIKNKPQEEDSL